MSKPQCPKLWRRLDHWSLGLGHSLGIGHLKLLARFPSNNLVHGLGIGGGLEGLAEFLLVTHFCNLGQSVKMLLKLALRHKEEHHEIDGLVVQGIEVNSLARAAQG